MEERTAADKARGVSDDPEPSQAERIRVTDRRRVNLNDSESTPDAGDARASEEPNFKPAYVEELEARARAAEQKTADVQSRFEQVRSELRRETDEIRQRLNRTADERVTREKAGFIAALLPVMDNLERAIEAARSGGSIDSLLDGLRGTVSGFESALVGAGVEPVEAVGARFDPEVHEAVDIIEVEPERDGLVTAQYSRGYRTGGQLLRPARVQVGRGRGAAHGA